LQILPSRAPLLPQQQVYDSTAAFGFDVRIVKWRAGLNIQFAIGLPPGHGYGRGPRDQIPASKLCIGAQDAEDFAKKPRHGASAKARLHHQQEARRMADDIADLEQQLDDKFQEILDAVATQLKLGKYDDLSDADQERVENEAEAAADQWMDDNEAGPKEPKTPFEKLLADYAALALKFPDEDDEDEDDEEEEDDHKPRK
jgi:hypothetical protein